MIRPHDAAQREVASPCIDICRMNAGTGLCDGCLRTIDEIAVWSSLNADAKSAVLRAVAARRDVSVVDGAKNAT